MSVYVDPLIPCVPTKAWRFNRSCHMFADTLEELHAFAVKVGLRREWFQQKQYPKGLGLPHYDLSPGRRQMAIVRGAIELDRRQAVDKWADLGWSPHKQMRDKKAAAAAKGVDQ